MPFLRTLVSWLKRVGYLCRAAAWAAVLGVIETVSSTRGRRVLGVLTLIALCAGFAFSKPLRSIEPGEIGIRVNRLTGGVTQLREGWALVIPAVHKLRRYPLRDQIYRPAESRAAGGRRAFQSVEGLSVGVEVAVRYALDAGRVQQVATSLPDEVQGQLIQPVIDGVLHRTFARHTVREIFSGKRAEIEQSIRTELAGLLGKDGVAIREVFLGNVDLPQEYKSGLERLLAEELAAEKMRYTLELKQKRVKESELEALADKVKREKAAEAAGLEQIIAAKARAEAMNHVLPLKQKEIEQKRLEAEASKVTRLKEAEASAAARRIEAAGEADSRRELAKAEAYRLEVTGKAQSDQLARDGVLIAKNPLLIQKTLADKLSDKIQVIIAPPGRGFFAESLLGNAAATARAAATAEAQKSKPVRDGDTDGE